MNKLLRVIFYLCLSVILFVAFYPLFSTVLAGSSLVLAPQELKDSIDKKNQELQEINNKLKETQKVLEQTQEQSKTLQQEVKKIDSNINGLNLSIKSSEITIEKLSLEIDSLGYDIKDAEREIFVKEAAITKIIQEIQQKENESPLMIFLRSENLTDSIFEVQGLSDLNYGLSKEVNTLRIVKEDLAKKLDDNVNKKYNKETEKQNLSNKKIILSDTKKDKQTVLNQTKNQEQIYQQSMTVLQQKQAEIANEINDLEEKLRLSFDPSLLPLKRPGVFAYPVSVPSVTQEYGATAFAQRAYKTKFHNGIDFRAPLGTPVMAAEDGVIMEAGNNGRIQYGKYILIKHDNNLATLYAHLSRQIVSKGTKVKRGDIIGYSGNTGYSTGPHVHFTVYWEPSINFQSFNGAGLVPIGVTINPADYL